jgi:cytosine/uracil/thiamine/allantoin permease
VHWLYDYAWFVGFFVSAAIYFLLMRNAVSAVELDSIRESA